MELYKTVRKEAEAEQVVERSRFITHVKPVSSREEADQFVASIRSRYKDATHNVPAMVIGDKSQIQWASDDGEPQGTAGRPMLDVLLGEEVHNVAVVVTRYFGGTLLGTGGLVRAYSRSVQEGLKQSIIIEKTKGSRITIQTDYNGVGKLQYLLGQRGIPIVDSQYTDVVKLQLLVEAEKITELKEAGTEATSGKAGWEEEKDLSFAFIEKEPVIF